MRVSRRRFLYMLGAAGLAAVLGIASTMIFGGRRDRDMKQPTLLGEDYLEMFEHEILASNLQVPWSIAFLDGDSLLVTERVGRLSLIQGGKRVTLARFNVASVGEAGLLGLAVSPGYPDDSRVYLYMSVPKDGGIVNRIVSYKLDVRALEVREENVLLDDIPGARLHDGGRIRFGPDGMLYATTGDALKPELSQDLGSLAGKILRLNPEGGVPEDNPFQGSYVYSYGHRNPQGLDWHPGSGRMYSSEHGPVGRDELNEIVAGGNYGWPLTAGLEGEWREGLIKPVIDFGDTSIAPAGASFVLKGLGELEGDMLIACLRGSMLVHVALDPEGNVKGYEYMLRDIYGRLRDVVPHPEGGVVIATSNRDGRGVPRQGDDKLIWIH